MPKLYILIIAPDSQIALVKSGSELAIPSTTVNDGDIKDLKNTELNKKLKLWYEAEDGVKNITFNLSRFKYCRSVDDAVVSTSSDIQICAILKVTKDEKLIVEKNTNYKFYSTYEFDSKGDRVLHKHISTLKSDDQTFFGKFQYLTDKTGNRLDKCINDAPIPSTGTKTTVTYKFYRPVFPFPLLIRPGLFGPSVVYSSNLPVVVSPFVSPSISRETSPITPRFSNVRNMDAPRVPRSPSPTVPRTRSPSPVVPRMRVGGYYEKYMKYKLKYLKLKQELNL